MSRWGRELVIETDSGNVLIEAAVDESGRAEITITDPSYDVQVFVNGKDWTRD